MPRKKKTTLWVIFAGPEPVKGPGTRYVAHDGTVTANRSDAARFYSFDDAAEFAKQKKIELTAIRYIGRAEFTDFEIQHGRG